jgi:phosphate transport system substrate-binding protein
MKKPIQLFTLLTILCCCLLSCSSPKAAAGSDTSGTITISGAWALYPMMMRWSEEFTRSYPDVQFDISAGGAGKGMADALAGAVDIGMVSREIHPEEIDKGAFWMGSFPAVFSWLLR